MSYKNTFQSWTDLETKENVITLITVYAGGSGVFDRCQAFFASFKYYKLGPVRIKLIPVSTLPVNPTEVAKSTENKLDPRDLMTPGCVRITNGEDFYWDITENDNEQTNREIYNTMIMDTRWFKWNLQKGITKSAYPKYWIIGQTRQDYYPGSIINVPVGDPRYKEGFKTTGALEFGFDGSTLAYTRAPGFSSDRGFIQTGQSGRLGWMPTDAIIETGIPNGEGEPAGAVERTPALNNIPEVELFRVLLPPAYKTTFFYRMFITETVYFKDRVIDPPTFMTTDQQPKIRKVMPLDRFIRTTGIEAVMPDVYRPQNYPAKPVKPNNLDDYHDEQGGKAP